MANDFEQKAAYGRGAEDAMAAWLQAEGFAVLPVYRLVGAPMLLSSPSMIVPDILAFKEGHGVWFEVKRRKTPWQQNQGDPLEAQANPRPVADYTKVQAATRMPVWLVWIFDSCDVVYGAAWSELPPPRCGPIISEGKPEDAVFWPIAVLHPIARREDVMSAKGPRVTIEPLVQLLGRREVAGSAASSRASAVEPPAAKKPPLPSPKTLADELG